MHQLTEQEKAVIDATLCEVDDMQIANGLPMLSCIVLHDDGAVSTAFWASVAKHNLMLQHESKEQCVVRLRNAARAFYAKEKT